MKTFIYPLLLFSLLFSCQKEKTHKVAYKIVVTSGQPYYSATYSSTKNATESTGSLTGKEWTSPAFNNREAGSSVFLELESSGGASYKLYILVDGDIQKEDHMDDPYGPKTIRLTLPD